jgi:signal transduction histidine kinase
MALQTGIMLVVDDDKVNRVILSNQLSMEGYTVFAVETGREAIQMLHAQPFDLVLLDLLMPEIDGFQVLEHMKADEALRHLPVIVISALDEMGSVVRSIQMGATDHLLKPCDPFLLRARINASLAAKRQRDQEAEYLRQVSQLTRAAAELEAGVFNPLKLGPVAERADALGHLARVFQQTAREVTTREHDLQQQNQFKSALINKITHDLRSPYIAASLSVQALQHCVEHRMFDQMKEELRRLDGQLREGHRMIDNIVAFASLAGKQIDLHLEETDIELLIHSITAPLQKQAEVRGTVISYNLALASLFVRVDRERLGQVIQHLAYNAIQLNRDRGPIQISCRRTQSEWIFSVADSGPSIAPDALETIWAAFAQSSDELQHGAEGLGLALVKYIVEAHHGIVFAKSSPGEGNVFGFRIPLA